MWLGALRPRRLAAFSRATASVSQASADDGGAGRSGGSSPGLRAEIGFGQGYILGDGQGLIPAQVWAGSKVSNADLNLAV